MLNWIFPGGFMKRLLAAAFLLLILCVPASAQSDWRIFGGFSYVRAETSLQPEPLELGQMNMYGWAASVTQYTSLPWLGVTAEVGGLYKTPNITIPADYFSPGVPATDTDYDNLVHTSVYTAMVGPSFAYRGNPDVEPFAHVLLGGVYGKASLSSGGEILLGSSASASDWVFGYAIGGGIDIKVSKYVALRGQTDWIRSAFHDGDKDRQNNLRVLGGLVLRFSQ
jgi:opacity protein-like surface antigen